MRFDHFELRWGEMAIELKMRYCLCDFLFRILLRSYFSNYEQLSIFIQIYFAEVDIIF